MLCTSTLESARRSPILERRLGVARDPEAGEEDVVDSLGRDGGYGTAGRRQDHGAPRHAAHQVDSGAELDRLAVLARSHLDHLPRLGLLQCLGDGARAAVAGAHPQHLAGRRAAAYWEEPALAQRRHGEGGRAPGRREERQAGWRTPPTASRLARSAKRAGRGAGRAASPSPSRSSSRRPQP